MSRDIILNIVRRHNQITPTDLVILRETIRLALGFDPADRSFLYN